MLSLYIRDSLTRVVVLPCTQCPPASQVGVAYVRLNGHLARDVLGPLPVYNLVPPPDVPARFGFNVAGTIVTLDGELRGGGDYGLSVRARDIPQGLAIAGTTLTFWGVPADPAHDAQRACAGQLAPCAGGPTCGAGVAPKALLRNPTSCTAPGAGLPVGVSIDSWAQPGVWASGSFTSHLPPGYPYPREAWGPRQGTTGCGGVPFDPGLSVAPDSGVAGAPAGYTRSRSRCRRARTRGLSARGTCGARRSGLPAGLRVNPSAADGLVGCTLSQIGLGSSADAACPDASRVGSLTVATPLLASPLTGSAYLAAPGARTGGNPFGTLLAVYLVAKGPGLIVKLAGRVETDPLSGRVTATFDDVPQLPFSSVRLAFAGGPRAVLVNPSWCGSYAASGEFTSWSGAVVSVTAPFAVGAGYAGPGATCPTPGARPFAPRFSAGVESNGAGRSSPFHLRLTRSDADEELGGLTVRLLARVADAVLCSDADAAARTCPSGASIGSVVAGAGAGPLPFYLGGGRVYVTGPYRGAPFGLSVVVPAVAGPFDLGTVVVRAAVFADRATAALRVVTDRLPQVLDGIPLQLRDVRVAVDRPGFMLNPTSCTPRHVRAVVTSTAGRVVALTEPFGIAECRDLPFDPRLRLAVGERGHTHVGDSVPLTAVLIQRPKSAGIGRVSVTLPSFLSARLPVVEAACSPAEFAGGRCEQARIGTVSAVTPLLRDPLRGGIYLVRRTGRPLPDIVMVLRGQVSVDLTGTVAIPGGRHLEAKFPAVPDVPVSRVVLRFSAGRRGVVGLALPLCSARGKTGSFETSPSR